MKDNTENNTPELDPMALPENHFEEQEISAEDNFQEKYSAPVFNTPGITEGENADLNEEAEKFDSEGNLIVADADDGEPFKFDDAIAESEQKELEELNAKLGSDYKSLKDLKAAYKSEDSNVEVQEIAQDKTYIDYFKSVLDPKQYDDRRIVFEDKKMIAQDAGKDITDPSIIEEINAEVETLEGNGVLSYAAGTLRQTVKEALKQREAKVSAFEQKENDSKKLSDSERKESIQESINEVFKAGDFLGIKPTKEDMIDIYKDISNNKHIEHLKTHPKDAVEFALFKRYKSVMEKNLNKPNYKAGVKNTLEAIGLTGSEQTGKGLNNQDSDEGDKSYFDQFVQ
jgi:hypothetical protein